MPITNEETIRVAHQILTEFEKWADQRIVDYNSFAGLSMESHTYNCYKTDTLRYAKANLASIIKKITEV